MSDEPRAYRLSSRLTMVVRFGYAAILAAISAGATWAILHPEPLGLLVGLAQPARIALIAGVWAAALFAMRMFAFVHATLEGDVVRVRGLWREWRFHAALMTEIIDSDRDGLGTIRVTLAETLPGLGRRFRILTPMLGMEREQVADLMRTVRSLRVGRETIVRVDARPRR